MIDDVQWADPASIEAIAHLVRYPPDAPALVVLAHRTADVPTPLRALLDLTSGEEHASALKLVTLTEAEADQLLVNVPDSVRPQIYEESGGNPFFIEQLLRSPFVAARHAGPVAAPLDVPSGVARAIEQELRSLDAEARRLLAAAAVAGDPFDAELAVDVAGLEPEHGLAMLDQLVEREMVRPNESLRLFRFRHPLLRRAVYDSFPPGRRLIAHQRAAAALEGAGAPVAAVAHHFVLVGRPGDEHAIDTLADAAEAVAGAAPATAGEWLSRAIALLPDDQVTRRLLLLARLAQARMSAGELNSAHTALVQMVDGLSASAGHEWIEAVTALASVELALGRHLGARRRIDDAIATSPDVTASALSPLLCVSVLEAAYSGDFARAEHAASVALQATEDERATSRTSARTLHALVLQLQGDGRTAFAEHRVGDGASGRDVDGRALQADDVLFARKRVLRRILRAGPVRRQPPRPAGRTGEVIAAGRAQPRSR